MSATNYSESGPFVLRFCITCMNNVLVSMLDAVCPYCGRKLGRRGACE